MSASAGRVRVCVAAMGGTIAMTGTGGARPRLTAADLVAAVPGLDRIAEVVPIELGRTPGASLRYLDVWEAASVVAAELRGGAAGVVLTQGTDTIEETAYALELLVREPGAVVVTGAMRPPDTPGADGAANLRDAVSVAAAGRDLGGVAVVLNGEVHAARHVAKAATVRPDAFTSPGSGPLGSVVEGRLQLLTAPTGGSPVVAATRPGRTDVWIPVITLTLDEDPRSLAGLEDADAVVVEGMGAGHAPHWLVEPLERLAARVPVVLTSRTRAAPVLRSTYGFAGSEQDLRARGLLTAGMLTTLKARTLLLALVHAGAPTTRIAATFHALEEEI